MDIENSIENLNSIQYLWSLVKELLYRDLKKIF